MAHKKMAMYEGKSAKCCDAKYSKMKDAIMRPDKSAKVVAVGKKKPNNKAKNVMVATGLKKTKK